MEYIIFLSLCANPVILIAVFLGLCYILYWSNTAFLGSHMIDNKCRNCGCWITDSIDKCPCEQHG